MKRDQLPLRLALIGGGLLAAAPVLVFASRLTTLALASWAYAIVAIVFVVGGAVCFVAAPVLAIRQKQAVAWLPFFFLLMLALSLGGFILAIADDPTIFLATLISAVFSLVVTWYERAFRKLQGVPVLSERPDR